MSRLALSLQRTARRLQKTVAPNVGDSIVEVWRSDRGAAPVAGGSSRDAAGNLIRSNPAASAPVVGSGMKKVGVYYSRYSHSRGGQEGDFGNTETAVPHIFVFNAGANPDIIGSDQLIVAVKRQDNQTIAQLGWQPEYAYESGDEEQPTVSNQRFYRRLSGTTSGTVEPVWPLAIGGIVADGDGQWKCIGFLPVYEVVSPGGGDTIPVEYIVLAERKGQGVKQ